MPAAVHTGNVTSTHLESPLNVGGVVPRSHGIRSPQRTLGMPLSVASTGRGLTAGGKLLR